MRAEKIREYLRAEPFQPFRVFLSDGSSYDVPHPELALISEMHFFVAVDVYPSGLARRTVMCDPLHVVRIEPIADTPDSG